jgi:RsiW-degrading membrane proteinase PrsW (M82 family)
VVSPSDRGPVRCAHCGRQVPAGEFCCRCGTALAVDETHPRRSSGRSYHYAAAPNEPAWAVRLTSTLFPQLPAHDMAAFRVSLVSGLGLIVGLGLVGAFSVALVAAALLVPLLVLLYFYDVNVYEDKPLLVVGRTVLSGAVGGVVLGVVANHLAVTPEQPGWSQLGSGPVIIRVVALPLVTVVLALAGPLALLRHPRFNDVLDGVVFGAASAVALQSALLLVTAWPITGLGLRPDQDSTAWTLRLVELGVFVPLIVAGGVGWASAALWARYRAPMRDRRALAPLGLPAPGVIVAGVAAMAAAIVSQVFSPLGRFLTLALLAALGLLLIRRAVHVGLLEEANDDQPGSDVRCANCGRSTALHTFCTACGVAMRALPKRPGPQQ